MLPVVIFKYCGVFNSNLPFPEKSWVTDAVEKSLKNLLIYGEKDPLREEILKAGFISQVEELPLDETLNDLG